MLKEVIAKGATVEDAIAKAIEELNVSRDDCTLEVLETPKKGLFGRNKEAVVKASYEVADEVEVEKEEIKEIKEEVKEQVKALRINTDDTDYNLKLKMAINYLQDILDKMGLDDVSLEISLNEEYATITFVGESIAILIGHHGETLDALQYLTALVCNRIDDDYYRITLDCGNYREKRKESLEVLAQKVALKVKKTGRNQILDPMNPFERRIIHSVVSDVDGVFSKSKGEEPNRRVVIFSENPKGGYKKRGGYEKKPYVHKSEPTMEEILKSDFKKREESAELYSKIEL